MTAVNDQPIEYRGFVHREQREKGSWISILRQIQGPTATVLEITARPTQASAFVWAFDKVQEAYETIGSMPGSKTGAVKLPRHCLWCGLLLRYPSAHPYCSGHKRTARKSRNRHPHRRESCLRPQKATYQCRGTAIMTARLLGLDCYQCIKGSDGCRAYHLTSGSGLLAQGRPHVNHDEETTK